MNYNIEEIKQMQENTRGELDRYLSEICAVVRDKNVKNPNSLTDRLLKESYGDMASSVFAFVPCILKHKDTKAMEILRTIEWQFFGFTEKDIAWHTNLRELLNNGNILEDILQYVDFTHYKAFKARVPSFIYSQIRTHTQINFLQQSNRYVETDYGYFMHDEVSEWLEIKDREHSGTKEDEWTRIVENSSPIELTKYMKECGVKRKEIYNRGADSLKIRPFSIGVNTLNPNSWEHFHNQRAVDKHTQIETALFVRELAKHI